MAKTAHDTSKPDLDHPGKAVHSDNEKSKMPERHDDDAHHASPADRPGKKPGEGEPPVG